MVRAWGGRGGGVGGFLDDEPPTGAQPGDEAFEEFVSSGNVDEDEAGVDEIEDGARVEVFGEGIAGDGRQAGAGGQEAVVTVEGGDLGTLVGEPPGDRPASRADLQAGASGGEVREPMTCWVMGS